MSGRFVGTWTVSTPSSVSGSCSSTVNPIGSIRRAISTGPSATPIWLWTRASGTETTNGSGTSPRTSSMPSATWSPGTVSASSSQKRRTDGSITHGSTPRSKRAEASVRKPSRFDVRAITMGVK